MARQALALISYPVIRFAYGAPFLPAVPALLALLPGVVCYSAQRVCGAYLLRLNCPLRMSAILGSAVIVNLGLNLLWIPRWGIVGAALASTASYALSATLFVAWAVRVSGLGAHEAMAWAPEDSRPIRRILTLRLGIWSRRGNPGLRVPQGVNAMRILIRSSKLAPVGGEPLAADSALDGGSFLNAMNARWNPNLLAAQFLWATKHAAVT